MTTYFPKPLDKQAAAISDSVSHTQDGLAIVANGNTHAAVSSGQFVYVKNHDTLAEGLYKATSAIDANGNLSTSNLAPDGSGGLNDLQSQITSLNSNIATASTDINVLKTKTVGLVKMYGAGNVRYLKITIPSNMNYGSLLVLCNGHTTTFNFNGGTPTRVEGTTFNITKSGDTCSIDFGSQYAHWIAIAGGLISQCTFVLSN